MTSQIRILVFGSRTYDDRGSIRQVLAQVANHYARTYGMQCSDITLVHGAARGADSLAAHEAEHEFGMKVEAHPADWSLGKAAGPIRNSEMLASGVDFAIGFFDGWTPGSVDMLKKLICRGIDVRVIARKR